MTFTVSNFLLHVSTALIMGLSGSPALAEDVSVNDSSSERDTTGDALITGLQRIEDGSIVSNSHTVKWRIFTDNGRDLFSKVGPFYFFLHHHFECSFSFTALGI